MRKCVPLLCTAQSAIVLKTLRNSEIWHPLESSFRPSHAAFLSANALRKARVPAKAGTHSTATRGTRAYESCCPPARPGDPFHGEARQGCPPACPPKLLGEGGSFSEGGLVTCRELRLAHAQLAFVSGIAANESCCPHDLPTEALRRR